MGTIRRNDPERTVLLDVIEREVDDITEADSLVQSRLREWVLERLRCQSTRLKREQETKIDELQVCPHTNT
jgi:hypothetical protein